MRYFPKVLASVVALSTLFAGSAWAQSAYPTKPITMYISFSVKGSSGLVGALLGKKMEEKLGQPIELKGHKGGRSGNIAAESAAGAAPDGYTLLMGTIGNIALLPNTWKDYPIDPLKALIPITRVTDTPDVLIAHPDAPYNTFEEFVAYAKANPGKVSYSNIAGPSIHAMEFASIIGTTGIDIALNDKIRGSANAMKAISEGTVQVTMTTVPYILPFLKEGKVKALALASQVPSPQLPGVPLFSTIGVPDIPRGSWNGLFLPAGTPQAIVDKLYDAIKYAAEDPEVKKAIEDMGMRVNIDPSPADFRSFLEAETARFGSLAKKYNVVVN